MTEALEYPSQRAGLALLVGISILTTLEGLKENNNNKRRQKNKRRHSKTLEIRNDTDQQTTTYKIEEKKPQNNKIVKWVKTTMI